LPPRPVGLRQDHDAPDAGGARVPRPWADPCGRAGAERRRHRHVRRSRGPRPWPRVPELRALAAHDRRPERRLRAGDASLAARPPRGPGDRAPVAAPDRGTRRTVSLAALRRTAAAGRARAEPRAGYERPAT